jgi:hypothetical protein
VEAEAAYFQALLLPSKYYPFRCFRFRFQITAVNGPKNQSNMVELQKRAWNTPGDTRALSCRPQELTFIKDMTCIHHILVSSVSHPIYCFFLFLCHVEMSFKGKQLII